MGLQDILKRVVRPMGITREQEDALDFIETFQKPPPVLDPEYLAKVRNTAANLGIEAGDEEDACASDAVVVPVPVPPEREIQIDYVVDPHLHAHAVFGASGGFKLRNDIFIRSEENKTIISTLVPEFGAAVSAFAAAGAGFVDPSIVGGDPRDHRRQTPLPTQQQALVLKEGLFSRFSTAIQSVVSSGKFPPQISHVTYQLPLGGRLAAALDLPTTAEEASQNREEHERFLVDSFKASRPRIVFTCDYSPSGRIEGCVVCWRRIATSSGYRIRRRNILDGTEELFVLSNEELEAQLSSIRDYVNDRALDFYDDLDEDQVRVFLDRDVPAHGFFTYTITAYQSRTYDSTKLFLAPASAVPFGPARRVQLRRLMEEIDPGSGLDTVSPYPVISRVVLGSEDMDWVLAAINFRRSEERGDPPEIVRAFSYFDAQLDFLVDQGVLGRFLVPSDVGSFESEFARSISISGVTPVLRESLRATGAFMRFGGEKKFLDAVFSAIDPDSGVADLRKLRANLKILLAPGGSRALFFRSNDIVVGTIAPETPYTAVIEKVDAGSFEGFGELMRTIREVSDHPEV
jgi:hypothetical protein